jgi:hypothetical protein
MATVYGHYLFDTEDELRDTEKSVESRSRTDNPRTWFYTQLAQAHGVRLSALVAHIVRWTRTKQGKEVNWTWDETHLFGEALGISARHVRRLLHQAKTLGLLDWRKSVNQIQVWVTDKKLYKHREDCTYYDRKLAKLIGMTESFLYRIIVGYTADVPLDKPLPGYKANYGVWQNLCPFLTEKAIAVALYKLKAQGLIDSDVQGTHRLARSRRYWAIADPSGLCGQAWLLVRGVLPPPIHTRPPSEVVGASRRSRAATQDAGGRGTKRCRPDSLRPASSE